jgi:hypothetical protein
LPAAKFFLRNFDAASGSFSAFCGQHSGLTKVFHRVFHLLAFRLLASGGKMP